ncbi:hypothetical protein BX257_4773 [Streptomyces sp. 3212.3]|uniref:hypothetical protein n=1 Tax=Streptomyces sp. 3212.3 TaxID=1938846 RepID=UPI000E285713|nr:hypothetical protein [Streptomyces sp. 3212.3]REE62160.1 hypothetical protein BX257_4773 [Streptomyces sp. 3212.3]
MSRAEGIVADACAAVIAAELQASLNITRAEARALGRAAVIALRGDGWFITCLPMTPALSTKSETCGTATGERDA